MCSRAGALPPPRPSPYVPIAMEEADRAPVPSKPAPRAAGVVAPPGMSGPEAAIRALTQVSNDPLVPPVIEAGDPDGAEIAPPEPFVPIEVVLDHKDDAPPIAPSRGAQPKPDEPFVPVVVDIDKPLERGPNPNARQRTHR